MQAQDTTTPVEQDNQIDVAVLALLLDSRHPLAEAEVEREMRDGIAAQDSLGRLAGAGLVHRHEGFVFPTRAAVRSAELVG